MVFARGSMVAGGTRPVVAVAVQWCRAAARRDPETVTVILVGVAGGRGRRPVIVGCGRGGGVCRGPVMVAKGMWRAG